MISGRRGTNKKATEKPRQPIPTKVQASDGVIPKVGEGPNKNRENEHNRKAIHVMYFLSIFAQSIPTRGDATAYVKQPIANV